VVAGGATFRNIQMQRGVFQKSQRNADSELAKQTVKSTGDGSTCNRKKVDGSKRASSSLGDGGGQSIVKGSGSNTSITSPSTIRFKRHVAGGSGGGGGTISSSSSSSSTMHVRSGGSKEKRKSSSAPAHPASGTMSAADLAKVAKLNSTARRSIEMYQRGENIVQIRVKLSVSVGEIMRHLAQALELGIAVDTDAVGLDSVKFKAIVAASRSSNSVGRQVDSAPIIATLKPKYPKVDDAMVRLALSLNQFRRKKRSNSTKEGSAAESTTENPPKRRKLPAML
jgi:hypothetical protein